MVLEWHLFFYLGEGRFLEVFAEGIVVVREWNPRARGFRLPLGIIVAPVRGMPFCEGISPRLDH